MELMQTYLSDDYLTEAQMANVVLNNLSKDTCTFISMESEGGQRNTPELIHSHVRDRYG